MQRIVSMFRRNKPRVTTTTTVLLCIALVACISIVHLLFFAQGPPPARVTQTVFFKFKKEVSGEEVSTVRFLPFLSFLFPFNAYQPT